MAETFANIRTVTIAFKGDTTEARQQISELQKELQHLGTFAIKAMERPLQGDKLAGALTIPHSALTDLETLQGLVNKLNATSTAGVGSDKANTFSILSNEASNYVKNLKRVEQAEKEAFARRTAAFDATAKRTIANVVPNSAKADSEIAIAARKKATLIEIETALAARLQEIRTNLGNGQISLQVANMQRVAALSKAANAREEAEAKAHAERLAAIQKATSRQFDPRFGTYNSPIRQNVPVSAMTQRMTDVNRANQSSIMLSGMSAAGASVNARQIAPPSGLRAWIDNLLNAGKAADAYSKKIKETDNALAKATQTHKGFIATVFEFSIAYRAANFVQQKFIDGLLNIPKAGIALESATASLSATFKTAMGAQKELSFLNEEAARTGIPIATLRDSYSQAAAAFVSSGESAERTRKIFENINTTAVTLHMSSERTGLVYTALGQIFNKTKVQAEELTKQLAQSIPGVTNAQARALQVSVAELYDRMKKGAVSAHDAVFALSEELARMFGGDAFARASSGLNAATGRIQTAWTLLTETVYKQNAQMIVSTLNWATTAINSAGEVGKKYDYLVDIIKTVAVGAAAAATAFYAANTASLVWATGLSGLISRLNLAKVSISGIYGAAVGVATGLAMLVNEEEAFLTRGKQLLEKKEKFTAAAKAQSEQEKNAILVETSDEVVTLREARDKAMDELMKIRARAGKYALPGADIELDATTRKYIEAQQGFDAELKRVREEKMRELAESKRLIEDSTKAADAERDRLAKDRSDIKAKLDSEELISGGDKGVSAAERFRRKLNKESAQIKEDLKSNDADIRAQAQEMQAQFDRIQKAYADKAAAVGGGGRSAASKALRDEISDAKRNHKIEIEDNKATLEELENQNDAHLISIEEYLAKKRTLLLANVEQERKAAEEALAAATGAGDTAKIDQYRDKLQELSKTARKVDLDVTGDANKKLREYSDLLARIKSQYLKLSGEPGKAEGQDFDMQNREELAILKAQIAAGDARAVTAEKELRMTRELSVAKAEISAWDEKGQLAQEQLNNALSRTNTLRNIGSMGEMQAMMEITAANERYIDQQEKIVQNYERIAAEAERNAKIVGDTSNLGVAQLKQQAENARTQLENFKKESDETARYFKRVVGDAFTSSFVALVKGTQTGKQAFASFVDSVIEGILKIIASEMQSAIISGFGNILGSAFGSSGGFSMSGAASSVGTTIGNLFGAGYPTAGASPTAGFKASAPPAAYQPQSLAVQSPNMTAQRSTEPAKGAAVGSSGNVYHINVSVEKGRNESSDETGRRVAEAIMRGIAKEEITKAGRLGGQLNRTMRSV